jgi:hypothetical protein
MTETPSDNATNHVVTTVGHGEWATPLAIATPSSRRASSRPPTSASPQWRGRRHRARARARASQRSGLVSNAVGFEHVGHVLTIGAKPRGIGTEQEVGDERSDRCEPLRSAENHFAEHALPGIDAAGDHARGTQRVDHVCA